jgi:hypothetical protein
LGSGGHRVRLVQDDELEALGKECTRLGELPDLIPDDVNAAVVGGVELEDLFSVVGTIDSPGESEDRGCFAGSGGSVEEEMRKTAFGYEVFDCL